MDCGSFLEGYSDYRDDLLPLPERVRFDAHLRACDSCARYDRVLEGGVRVLAQAEELTVSDDFMDRLQHRLYHVDDELAAERRRRARPLPRRTAQAAAGLAAAVAAVALLPRAYDRAAPDAAPPPSVAAAPAAAPAYRVAAAPEAAGDGAGLTAQLEEVGVQVLPLPYRQAVHQSASRVTLASYAHGE